MALKEMQLSVVMFATAKMFSLTARRQPEFAARLKQKNLTAQIKVLENNQGRWFTLKNGKMKSGAGIHPNPDIVMFFTKLDTACRLMSPSKSWLDFINAAKNALVGMEGPDELTVWFAETLGMMMTVDSDYGEKLPGGVTRYSNISNGGPLHVDVKDGKIIRTIPIEFTKDDAPTWTIEAKGKKFSPPRKTTLSCHGVTWKSMIYSKNRLLYPMIREDFDPKGERNPQNRGTSGYRRISWEEANEIVASEIIRVKTVHGPGAIANSAGSHHCWGNLGYFLSVRNKFFNNIGWTNVFQNPDSWEGWYWGAIHHWGNSGRLGSPEVYGTMTDLMKNAEMLVLWSSDPESTAGVYGAHEGTVRRKWLQELGIKVIHIDPYLNHTAAWLGGKWFAPKVGTDNALIFALAYVWITEGLYDKWFIENRTAGFDKWKDIVLGKTDGVPKTPEWQEKETGLAASEVRALAREWGTKRTYLAPGGAPGVGGACRTATGADFSRGMVYLMAMQGIGKPGVNFGSMQSGPPLDLSFYFPGYAEGGMSGDLSQTANAMFLFQNMPHLPSLNTVTQRLPRLKLPEAIMTGKCEGFPTDSMTIEGQFQKFKYPSPGYSPVKFYWRYGGSHIGTQVGGNEFAKMYQSENLEFVVNQSIWNEGEVRFADIILPACTNFERWDIGEFANCGGYVYHSMSQCNHRVFLLQHKCIEPLGESKSDFQIFLDISKKLGLGAAFAEGLTELDWCKRMFEGTDLPRVISWKKFYKKGYYVLPPKAATLPDPVSFNWFYEGRPKDTPELMPLPGDYKKFRMGMQTQTGLIEFESSSLKRFAPDDEERAPVMTYRRSWEGPGCELEKKYPLQLMSPHPRFSFHTHADGKDSTLNDIKNHRILIDGYYYWIVRMSPKDAEARGLKENELVEVFNDRGVVICALQITSRVRPGVVHSYESSAVYDPIGRPGYSTDKGGCINILAPTRMMIKNSHAMAAMSMLVEIKKYYGAEVTQ
jgi:trimethylamine-N-oxide reductase (cytochrome c)